MELPVFTFEAKETTKTCAFPSVLEEEVSHAGHLVYLSAKAHLAAQRQGTHQAKERAFVRGSTGKLRKQKGTGNARVGSRKSPIFRGGGRAFGPSPRDYTLKLNKKAGRLAKRVALAKKLLDKQVMVVEDFSFEAPKTKRYLEFLTHFSLQNKQTLLVMNADNKNVFFSSRNLPQAKVQVVSFLSTYELLYSERIIFFEGAVDGLAQLLR